MAGGYLGGILRAPGFCPVVRLALSSTATDRRCLEDLMQSMVRLCAVLMLLALTLSACDGNDAAGSRTAASGGTPVSKSAGEAVVGATREAAAPASSPPTSASPVPG